MPHVFISYSRKDTAFVDTLERDLNARGIVTWRDTSSIVGGTDWYHSIVRGVHQSYALIQVVTDAADESEWVECEALYAKQQQVPLVPVLPSPHPIPLYMINRQPVSFTDYAEGLARLAAALDKLPRTTPEDRQPQRPALPSDRAAEQDYLNLLLSRIEYDLDTKLYVSLLATPERAARQMQGLVGRRRPALGRLGIECVRGEEFDRPGEPVPDARIPIREMRRVVLLGEPGSGKTTTLLQLAVDLAQEALADPTKPLPVFVPLRSYAGAQPFEDFVREQLGILKEQYDRLVGERRLVLLCDALNEMQRQANGRDLPAEVCETLRGQPVWVVSCRVRDYQEELKNLPDVGKVRLKPLDPPRIKAVIDRRFVDRPERAAALWDDLRGSDDLLTAWQVFGAAGKVEAFWEHRKLEAVKLGYSVAAWDRMHVDRRRMMLLCRNPYMLFLVCEIFDAKGGLPSNRGALFATFVDDLLLREEEISQSTKRDWIDAAIIRRALTQLAYAIQISASGTEITRSEAEHILVGKLGEANSELLLRLAAAASLLNVGERVHFTHQLLQEYFASEVMGSVMDRCELPDQFWPLEVWWEPQGWEETAIILAGVRDDPEGVARWIAPVQPWLAYQALTKSGIDVDLDAIAPETRTVLVESACSKQTESNPVGRAAAYRVLGAFGEDKRWGVGSSLVVLRNRREMHIPNIDWVRVAGGKFVYQNGEDLTVPAFEIARYPITYAQFRCFVDAMDYNDARWWVAMPEEEVANGVVYRTQELDEQRLQFGNHPRERVSWYQAVAFCRWLGDKLETDVMLPTERQWECAARGKDGLLYPYGDDFDAMKGNTRETGIGQTSAAGIFPQGASPDGLLDMSGNVWQWCLDKFAFSNHVEIDASGSRRVVRGGSYDSPPTGALTIHRERHHPAKRFNRLGFRVCHVLSRPP